MFRMSTLQGSKLKLFLSQHLVTWNHRGAAREKAHFPHRLLFFSSQLAYCIVQFLEKDPILTEPVNVILFETVYWCYWSNGQLSFIGNWLLHGVLSFFFLVSLENSPHSMCIFHLGSAYPFMIKRMMHYSALLDDENPLNTRKKLKIDVNGTVIKKWKW